MTQMDLGLNLSTKRTRKREFLDEMTRVVPWQKLIALIEPHYPKGKTGRPPFPIATMLRIHFLQQWFSLSDPAMEEALHDIPLYREFALLDAGMTRLPDESTILRFRHLLEAHELSVGMLAAVNEILQSEGLDAQGRLGGRRDADCRAQFDEEGRHARPRDAPDAKGRQLVLWHEGAHRSRCAVGSGAHREVHAGERSRHHGGA